MFDAAGIAPPQPALSTTSVEFCRELLRRGGYLSVLPTGLIAADLAARRLVVLPVPGFDWRRPVQLVYRADAIREPAVLATVQALHEVADLSAPDGTDHRDAKYAWPANRG